MTEERRDEEYETAQIITAIRMGEEARDQTLLQVAALSYAKGIHDGAEIIKRRRKE